MNTPALGAVSDELRAAEFVDPAMDTALDVGTLCLVQITSRKRTFRPMAVGDLEPMVDVLSALAPVRVIHNARFERRVRAALGIPLDGVFDTLKASRRARGPGGHSLSLVYERELGISLNQSEQASNWSRRPLDAQLHYAPLEAEILLALHERFKTYSVRSTRGEAQHDD